MNSFEELFQLAKELETATETGKAEDIQQPLNALRDAAHQVQRAFSGSWLGYHSRVYYEGFAPAPPGSLLRIKELHDTAQLKAAQLQRQTEQLSSWNRSLEERSQRLAANSIKSDRDRGCAATDVP